jgi:hypothetical protein
LVEWRVLLTAALVRGAGSGGGISIIVSEMVEAFIYIFWSTVGPGWEPKRKEKKMVEEREC